MTGNAREVVPLAVRFSSPEKAPVRPETGGAMAVSPHAGPFEIEGELRRACEEAVSRYPTRRAATMAVLHETQDRLGWLPEEAVEEAARFLGVPVVQVWEVVTFYPMYRTRPRGRHLVEVCRNVSCDLRGSSGLLRHLRERLGVEVGGTTPDGEFTLETVECLAACGGAPVLALDGDFHEKATPEAADALLEAARSRDAEGGA